MDSTASFLSVHALIIPFIYAFMCIHCKIAQSLPVNSRKSLMCDHPYSLLYEIKRLLQSVYVYVTVIIQL